MSRGEVKCPYNRKDDLEVCLKCGRRKCFFDWERRGMAAKVDGIRVPALPLRDDWLKLMQDKVLELGWKVKERKENGIETGLRGKYKNGGTPALKTRIKLFESMPEIFLPEAAKLMELYRKRLDGSIPDSEYLKILKDCEEG